MAKTFTVKEIVATAAITFVISGIGGSLLQSYLDRAKPHVSVDSLEFYGERVEVSKKAIKLDTDIIWLGPLDNHMDYSALQSVEIKATEAIERFSDAEEIITTWLDEAGEADISHGELIMKSPFVKESKLTNHMVSYIFNVLRRREALNLPQEITKTDSKNTIFDVTNLGERGWEVRFDNLGIRFPLDVSFTDREKQSLEEIVYSFSQGNIENIAYLHRSFLENINHELPLIKDLQEELRSNLVNASKLSLQLTVSNLGKSPFVLNPYYYAKIRYGSKDVLVGFRVILGSESAKKNVNRYIGALLDPERERGSEFNTTNYLIGSITEPYITIPSGGSVRIDLLSIDPLGNKGDELLQGYKTEGLSVKVATRTLDDSVVLSRATVFSEKTSKHWEINKEKIEEYL